MRERFSKHRHIRQVKGHMIQSLWHWFAFEQSDSDVVVSDGNAIFKVEFLAQTQGPLKPAGTLFWIAYSKAEVADDAQNKWCFHSANLSSSIKGTDGLTAKT